jgi:hypothetical protein
MNKIGEENFENNLECILQLLPSFDLISIYIILQYVFGLDEFSKRMQSKLFSKFASPILFM